MLTSFHEIHPPVATITLPETRRTPCTLCDDDIRDIADAVYRDDNPLRFESVRQAASMFKRVGYTITRSSVPVSASVPAHVVIGKLVIDRYLHVVTYHRREVVLNLREFELLDVLARHPSRMFTRQMLLDLAWPHAYDVDERTVDVHVWCAMTS